MNNKSDITLESLVARVEALESLVNRMLLQLHDLTEQIDASQPTILATDSVPRRQTHKNQQSAKPKQQKQPVRVKRALTEDDQRKREASEAANAAARELIIEALSDGSALTEREIVERTGITRNRFQKARQTLLNSQVLLRDKANKRITDHLFRLNKEKTDV